MKKQKVLLIADSNMSLSGVPVVFMSIVKQLQDKYCFDIIVLKDNDMFFEKEFLSYGGKVFSFNCPKPDNFFKKLYWLTIKYPNEVKKFLKNKISLNEYAILHSFHEGFSYPFIKEAKNAGITKRILHVCSASSAYPAKKTIKQRLLNSYQRKAMDYCTDIIFVSNQALSLNDYKGKGKVLYSYYDNERCDQIIKCKHDNLVLTQIGTFSKRKNQMFSLSVLKNVIKDIPSAKLIIVGKELEQGYLNLMEEYIMDNCLQNNVLFYKPDFDKTLLISETSYILYPSIMESFGLVLIESQSNGVHCFANKNLPEDTDMGNVDFLMLDTKTWADKIIDFYKQNKNKRKEPINKNRFDVKQFKATLEAIYNH